MLDTLGEIARLEGDVALLARGFGLGRVDVGEAGLFGLLAFCVFELGEDVGSAVLGKGLVEVLDAVVVILLADVGGSDATQGSAARGVEPCPSAVSVPRVCRWYRTHFAMSL